MTKFRGVAKHKDGAEPGALVEVERAEVAS